MIVVAGPKRPDRAGAGPAHRPGRDVFVHTTTPKCSRSLKCAPIVTRRADDDATARRLLCILLDLKELGLLEAQDGPAALDVARSERPGVAVLDLGASGLGGVDVCRALRADAELASIKVVILSEQGRLADRVAAHAAGADAYVAKPYSSLALLDVVQRLSRG